MHNIERNNIKEEYDYIDTMKVSYIGIDYDGRKEVSQLGNAFTQSILIIWSFVVLKQMFCERFESSLFLWM